MLTCKYNYVFFMSMTQTEPLLQVLRWEAQLCHKTAQQSQHLRAKASCTLSCCAVLTKGSHPHQPMLRHTP